MAQKFPIGTWFYHPADAFPPQEVDIWHNCGLTCTFSPKIVFGKDDPASIIPFLDRAASYNMKLIAYVFNLEDGNYRENFKSVYNVLKGHPALAGFFVKDEPSTREEIDKAIEYLRIQKEIAPELEPYLNLQGSTHAIDNVHQYGSMDNLMQHIASTGAKHICFDAYTQTINYDAIDFFFSDVIPTVEAAEHNGIEPWVTPICTAHYAYQIPTEYMINWQINVSAACGCRGIMWFRYYDRDISINYHGSPIDQYHNLTDHYYMMLRAQKTFNDHFGELMLKLRHKRTYCLGRHYTDVPYFEKGCHDLIPMENYLDSIIGFFEDENGTEYMAVVNASYNESNRWPMSFDPEKCTVTMLTFNGKHEEVMESKPDDDTTFLYPGQMNLFRIDRR